MCNSDNNSLRAGFVSYLLYQIGSWLYLSITFSLTSHMHHLLCKKPHHESHSLSKNHMLILVCIFFIIVIIANKSTCIFSSSLISLVNSVYSIIQNLIIYVEISTVSAVQIHPGYNSVDLHHVLFVY